jgi:hypothetical protein
MQKNRQALSAFFRLTVQNYVVPIYAKLRLQHKTAEENRQDV